jgi:hypothetical protein
MSVSTEDALLLAAKNFLKAMKRFNATNGLKSNRNNGMAIAGYNIAVDQILLCEEMQLLRAEVRLALEKKGMRP